MNASTTQAAPTARTFNGEEYPADALGSTVHRISHEFLNGWHVCYHNNDDLVTAWRAEGGAMTEAEGYVDTDGYPAGANLFHAQSIRVVAGAVNACGHRTFSPGPWSRQISGKAGYQYTRESAAQLRADGFEVRADEIT